jgi:hypothetical protein
VLRKRAIAAALAVIGASLIWTVGAEAALTELTVRIEGREKTLFEGPILTEGHDVRASSDTAARHCDGTNNGAHPAPVPTPTAAAVDAMELTGQSFDGRWFPGFDDYFVKRWGPDSEDPDTGAFWGILVDGELTAVGGCQFGVSAGSEVLWVYDAFSGRSLLRLAAADDPSTAPTPPLPTARVEVDQPLALRVQSYSGAEGQTPEVKPAEGVEVGPVLTEAGTGFETVDTAGPSAVTTAAGGTADVSFETSGWHRVKAEEEAGFIRSNRLDVCVEPPGGGGCGPLPADARLRVPARYEASGQVQTGGNGGGPPAVNPAPSNAFVLRLGGLDRRAGTATIRAVVPGPGRLSLSGAGIQAVSVGAPGAGTVKLPVSPTARARAALLGKGRLQVTLRVAFTPTAGQSATRKRSIVLKLGSPAG